MFTDRLQSRAGLVRNKIDIPAPASCRSCSDGGRLDPNEFMTVEVERIILDMANSRVVNHHISAWRNHSELPKRRGRHA